jgi:hypothetical protein
VPETLAPPTGDNLGTDRLCRRRVAGLVDDRRETIASEAECGGPANAAGGAGHDCGSRVNLAPPQGPPPCACRHTGSSPGDAARTPGGG